MELELLVESGLAPMEAVVAGTRNAAGVIRRANDLGTIEPQKLADLIVVAGDPVRDISACREIRLVVKNGSIVVDRLARRPMPLQPPPSPRDN
jgi:imidazolonepropionase-like amidohydrolase